MTTTTDVNVADSSDNQVNLIGPGSRLRLARENANLSITDIAMRLHLRNQVIESIENDNYSDAPQFVFIRGYLRAYANLMHLPAQEIIDAFDNLSIDESPTDRPVWRLSKKQVTSKDRPVRWATYFIVLCLITLVGTWWHSQKNNLQNKLKVDQEQQQVVMQNLDTPEKPPLRKLKSIKQVIAEKIKNESSRILANKKPDQPSDKTTQ